ncbi:hypothetical protein BDV96DRAFT_303100 [Lophiotrema nucula]|uniref:Uncharacterized protein n=1 Tax=Lophiotrema nucula TaxID=690887 RepID=A0A6A5YM70_9PLEO|nr:hypothetical protein BDV96DRAFT_303100 [Lophiotrema nucula]
MKRTASPVARDEVASSSKKLRGIQSEEKRIVEDVNDLTAQIAALEQERRRKFDELQKQTAKFTEEAATYSQISTRHAVGDMRTKLPREIRDMIYHHLWDWSAIYAFAGLEKLTYNKCPGGECHCLRGIKIPRYLDPDFFGPDGAIEAAEALFRKLPWTTGLVRADDIKHILTNDPFHIGFSPLNAVRQLTVRFSLDRCARKERGTSREVRFYEKDLLSLQVLPEPERTAKWLQTYFEEDPAGKITRYRMCNMYMYCLGRLPFSPKNPPLPGLWEFVNEVKRVFPQTGSGMRYRIKHKSPAVTSRT